MNGVRCGETGTAEIARVTYALIAIPLHHPQKTKLRRVQHSRLSLYPFGREWVSNTVNLYTSRFEISQCFKRVSSSGSLFLLQKVPRQSSALFGCSCTTNFCTIHHEDLATIASSIQTARAAAHPEIPPLSVILIPSLRLSSLANPYQRLV